MIDVKYPLDKSVVLTNAKAEFVPTIVAGTHTICQAILDGNITIAIGEGDCISQEDYSESIGISTATADAKKKALDALIEKEIYHQYRLLSSSDNT